MATSVYIYGIRAALVLHREGLHLSRFVPIQMYSELKTINAINSALEGAVRLKQAPLDFSFHLLQNVKLFSKLFSDSQKKTMDYKSMVFGQKLKNLSSANHDTRQ